MLQHGSADLAGHVPRVLRPAYKDYIGGLREMGVEQVFIDTDGDVRLIIPELMECGFTGVHALEREFARRFRTVWDRGCHTPSFDHSGPPGISWENPAFHATLPCVAPVPTGTRGRPIGWRASWAAVKGSRLRRPQGRKGLAYRVL